MTDKKLNELLKKSLLALIAAGAVWVFFRYLIGWVLPFIIAWVLARLIRPPAELLRRRLRLPRWLAVTLSSVLILAVVLALAGLIVSRVIFELSSLEQRLPERRVFSPVPGTGRTRWRRACLRVSGALSSAPSPPSPPRRASCPGSS